MAVMVMKRRITAVRRPTPGLDLGRVAGSGRPAEVDFTDNNFTASRLLLALLVVLGHFQRLAGVTSEPLPFGYAGTAVDCFFVVSGYLVSNSFDRDPNLGRFFIRRLFRIYPLYLAVVLAQTRIVGCIESAGAGTPADLCCATFS
jgi:peptidoglycan/LPS O-acetylase OafA/YrhL